MVQSIESQPSSDAARHLEKVKAFYEAAPPDSRWFGKQYRKLLGHYYRLLIPADASVLEIGCGGGELLSMLPNRDIAGVDLSSRQVQRARTRLPHGHFIEGAGESFSLNRKFDFIILSETINFAADVQAILEQLHAVSHSGTRLIMNYHSNLWRPILDLSSLLGLKTATPATNWFTRADVRNVLWLSEWDELKSSPRILMPIPLLGLDVILNRYLAHLLPVFCLSHFTIAKPRQKNPGDYTVSVVIPARNEAGNIAAAVERMPSLGRGVEIIFVEGHSKDNTWDEIQRVAALRTDANIVCFQQSGKGKGNAVREAFDRATGDILMILDADLTMPPEQLPKFYDALASGRAEFANGVRLVYPMDDQAMQFLNLCANKTFGILFTWMMGQSVKDTLCGTKVVFRKDYARIAANRAYFGDFDPFGDFDLLFGANHLHLKIADIPIRYRERTYGSTNIHRWSHGVLLLRMVLFAARKIKFI